MMLRWQPAGGVSVPMRLRSLRRGRLPPLTLAATAQPWICGLPQRQMYGASMKGTAVHWADGLACMLLEEIIPKRYEKPNRLRGTGK